MKPIINQNTITQKSVTLFLMATLLLTFPTLAGYKLNWHTIDGGGGVSSSGQYTIFGTIGQADAAYSQEGPYEVLGGFWPGEPLCVVDFHHFARFAEYWLDAPCNAGNNWCGGADLDQLGDVDGADFGLFVGEWLWYCPLDWPLK